MIQTLCILRQVSDHPEKLRRDLIAIGHEMGPDCEPASVRIVQSFAEDALRQNHASGAEGPRVGSGQKATLQRWRNSKNDIIKPSHRVPVVGSRLPGCTVGGRPVFRQCLSGRLSLYALNYGSVPEPLLPPIWLLQNPHHEAGFTRCILNWEDRRCWMIATMRTINRCFVPLEVTPKLVFGDALTPYRCQLAHYDVDRNAWRIFRRIA